MSLALHYWMRGAHHRCGPHLRNDLYCVEWGWTILYYIVVFCCRAGFLRPFSVHSPSLSLSACLMATKPPSSARSCSIWILLPLVGLPLIVPSSVISCISSSCPKSWPMFPLQNGVEYLPVFLYSFENFLISRPLFIKPAVSFLLHDQHSKASGLFLSVWFNVHPCRCWMFPESKNRTLVLDNKCNR